MVMGDDAIKEEADEVMEDAEGVEESQAADGLGLPAADLFHPTIRDIGPEFFAPVLHSLTFRVQGLVT